MKSHPDRVKLEELFPYIRKYQALASEHGINDIFQDNGGKYLQLFLVTGLIVVEGREGNDGEDEDGNEYELKTVNVSLTSSFSTHHHLNPVILKKYRKASWVFAVYESIELREIYSMNPDQLEPYFQRWEDKWNLTKKDINNPKIPVNFVRKFGKKLFPGLLGSL